MMKIALGFSKYREVPTEEAPDPCEQVCLVVGRNEDYTATIVVWKPDGSTFILDRAHLVQCCDDIGAHYEECLDDEHIEEPEKDPSQEIAPTFVREEKLPGPQEPASGPGGDLPHDVPLTS